jgi:hypothetical protein
LGFAGAAGVVAAGAGAGAEALVLLLLVVERGFNCWANVAEAPAISTINNKVFFIVHLGLGC